jgi:thiol-disulfide isomerase/thioredoxin
MRWLALLLLVGCKTDPPPPAEKPPTPHVVFVAATEGDVATLVQRELARSNGARVLVYVGATWCEPCRRFHDTAQTGALDKALPSIRFLEFDLDRDEERLKEAGYTSKYIPLFALPRTDGRASGKQIAGSVSGPGSPAEITPRLQVLLKDG